MEEEKKKNKISLTTYVLSLIILALIAIIAIIVIINQNNDEDKSKQNTNNSVVESGQQTNVTETPTEPTEPEPTETKTYEEITSELERIDVLSVTDVEKEDGKYILKGVIYTQYTMTEDEVEKAVADGKMTIGGETYPVKNSTEDGIEYELFYGVEEPFALYAISKNETGTYYLECEAQISDVWKMTDQYRKITLDEDVTFEDHDYGESTSLEEEFKDFESREAVETTNPEWAYTFEFKNGKCIKVMSHLTGI